MDNSPLDGLTAQTCSKRHELVLADQQDIHISLIAGPEELASDLARAKLMLRPVAPLKGTRQTCKALSEEPDLCSNERQSTERKLICYTGHLERTASGLGSVEEGRRIYYDEVLALSELGTIIGAVKEVVLDLGVASSRIYAPQKIEWNAVIDAIRRTCRPDAVIKVVVTFDWTMLAATAKFSISFVVGELIAFKPADIAAASRTPSAKLPFLAAYILLRRLIGDLKEFEVGEREGPGMLKP